MTSGLRSRTWCGRGPRVTAAESRDVDEPQGSPVTFGVIVFEGRLRRARQVVLAFDSAADADAYANAARFADYLVAPLSFLSPAGVRRG